MIQLCPDFDEYKSTYDINGRLKNGLQCLNWAQMSGLGMRCKIIWDETHYVCAKNSFKAAKNDI